MKYKNKIASFFLIATFALLSVSCQKSQTASGNTQPQQTVKAQSPTEAYKMLYAACKAKDTATIKQLMSKGSMGIAGMLAAQQKKSLESVLENGLVAPTLADSLTEIRDERVKDNFGAVEVFNPKDNKWEDLPFVLEDGSWKIAVGDLFQGSYVSPGKSIGQMESDASNKMTKIENFPSTVNGNKSTQMPPVSNTNKSSVTPIEEKPKK